MFHNVFKDKKVLVTGHTGFKGSWLTVWLLHLGAKVFGISRDIPSEPSMFEELRLGDMVTDYRQDIKDPDKVAGIFAEINPDFVFHLAAQPIVSLSYKNPLDTIFSNALGTTSILESIRLLNKDVVAVIITSDKCYDNIEQVWGYKESDALGGKDIYSGSKGMAELAYKSYFHSFFKKNEKIKSATARAGNVIGGGDWAVDRMVPDCMRAWSQGRPVEIRSPKSTRPWQHVLEPLSGYLTLAAQLSTSAAINGESFNFGPNAEYAHTVEDILTDLSRRWGGGSLQEAYRVAEQVHFHEAGLLKLNCDKALHYLTWVPALTYAELMDFTSSWYYEYYHARNRDMFRFTVDQIKKYADCAVKKGVPWAWE